MALKHLVVHLDGAGATAVRLDVAIALARRFDARVSGLFAEGQALGPSIVARRAHEDLVRARDEARAVFEVKAKAASLATDWWPLDAGEYSDLVGLTAACCRYADLAVFGQHEAGNLRVPEDLVEQVILRSGRPVLVVPAFGRFTAVGTRVLVAWNASREAARAVHDALPLLEMAESVTVLSLQDTAAATAPSPVPFVDVVAHLRAHGVEARYEKVVKDELGLVDTVLNRGSDLAADLIVMGAQAQLGLPLPRTGPSTRAMLASMTAPVLFSW